MFVAGGSKNRTWSSYRKDQENLVQAPDPGADEHLASINEYNCPMSWGVVVLVRKDLTKFFEQVFLFPNTNTISLSTQSQNSNTPTFFHFVYVPCEENGKVMWEEMLGVLKPMSCATHWLAGDFNCYLSTRDSKPGLITAPKALRSIIKELDLCDTWRGVDPANELLYTPTFGRINKASAWGE